MELIYEDKYAGQRKFYVQDYIGKKIGRLTVLGRIPNTTPIMWLCSCDCGSKHPTKASHLLSGVARSCGCYHKDKMKEVLTTHGLCSHPLYKTWGGMKSRCLSKGDPSYKNYGGRGITVCEEWVDSAEAFIEWCLENGWEEGLQIDREDNEGNYGPSNCRFVKPVINLLNARTRITNSSGYVGISKMGNSKYRAYISLDMVTKHLGSFNTKLEALDARNNYIIDNNFPHKLQEYVGE